MDKQVVRDIFSKKLKLAIKENQLDNLTYKKLGAFFNVSEMAVHKWLNAKAIPNLTKIPDIANKLAVSVEYLLDNSPTVNNKDDEIYLINNYKKLSKNQQKIVRDIIEAFLIK